MQFELEFKGLVRNVTSCRNFYILLNRLIQFLSVIFHNMLVRSTLFGLFVSLFLIFTNLAQAQAQPSSTTCPTIGVSYTINGTTPTAITNNATSTTVIVANGGSMQVSPLTANVPTANLRFLADWISNGNFADNGNPLPTSRPRAIVGVGYFNQIYSPYSLVNPALTGFTSQTMTPFIDTNGNWQYDADTECLGMPTVVIHVIESTTICPPISFSYTATGSSAVQISNTGLGSVTVPIGNGGYLLFSEGASNTQQTNLRFIERIRFSGPLNTDIGTITDSVLVFQTSANTSTNRYFNRIVGPFTLPNPNVAVTMSATVTPYVDLNNDGQFTPATECLGTPTQITYVISSTNSNCIPVTFSYTATGSAPAFVSNTNTSPAVMPMCSGSYMNVSGLTTNVPTGNLRFRDVVRFSGPIITEIGLLTAPQMTFDVSVTQYFNRVYGPYTLPNPAVSVTLSETFTPYIDLNGNQQYDPQTECAGALAVLIYEISNELRTVRSGSWNDPATWSCGRVPTVTEPVVVSHTVTVPTNYIAQAKQVGYTAGGRIVFQPNGQLLLWGTPCNPITADPLTLLTQHLWKIDELRGVTGNTADYYKRGGNTNTVNFDNNYEIKFNADGTGYNQVNGQNSPLSWSYTNPDRTSLTITFQGSTINWENIAVRNTVLQYTEYFVNGGANALGQIKRSPR